MTHGRSEVSGAGSRILIVGARIGGLALARMLVGKDYDVHVIERLSAWDRGTGIYLAGNAMRALTCLYSLLSVTLLSIGRDSGLVVDHLLERRRASRDSETVSLAVG